MTTILNRIGIIGGGGWIGRAMIQQLHAAGFLQNHLLWVSYRSASPSEFSQIKNLTVTKDNNELLSHCDTIILSVRPHHFPDLKLDLRNHLVMSVMAGVSVERIHAITKAMQIVRAMPNAAIEIGESYTPWYANEAVGAENCKDIQNWLQLFGAADQVMHEDLINFFTALTGSGQGWVAYFQQVLIETALDHGLSHQIAEHAVKQLFLGMGKLLIAENEPINELVKSLIDYAGTTAAGLNVMVKSPIKHSVASAIEAAYKKALSDMTKS